jgi:hypothetical protein
LFDLGFSIATGFSQWITQKILSALAKRLLPKFKLPKQLTKQPVLTFIRLRITQNQSRFFISFKNGLLYRFYKQKP